MVGKPGRGHADYPPAQVWENTGYEHAGIFPVSEACRKGRFVSASGYLERGKVPGLAGDVSGYLSELCKCQGNELSDGAENDMPDVCKPVCRFPVSVKGEAFWQCR